MRAALLPLDGSNQGAELGAYFLNSLREIFCTDLLDIPDPLGDHEVRLKLAHRSLGYVQIPDRLRDRLSFLSFCNVGRYRNCGSSKLVSKAEILVKVTVFRDRVHLYCQWGCPLPNPKILKMSNSHMLIAQVPHVALVARPAGTAPPFHLQVQLADTTQNSMPAQNRHDSVL
jgi:hypothetical protein